MADHLCTQLSEQAVRERYALLSQACESAAGTGNQQLEQQLQALEQIIERDLPALARKGSPDNITDLLQALRLEMARFREFCEYPALPSKVVVGLGGSFSAGKSSLINALIGDRECLVTEVDPTTSLPTYLVQGKGEQTEVHAINLFNRVVSLSHEQFRTLTHEEKSRYGSQVSSLLKSVVVAHPALPWGNLALLDTPGYSKAEQAGCERSDANLARTQLNSAQFIVWLVPADKGTITEEDISFLARLDITIPKLIVVSKSDKHLQEDIENIVSLIRESLKNKDISIVNVISFSDRSNSGKDDLHRYLSRWNDSYFECGTAKEIHDYFLGCQSHVDVAILIENFKCKIFSLYDTIYEYGNSEWVTRNVGSWELIENAAEECSQKIKQLSEFGNSVISVRKKIQSQLYTIYNHFSMFFTEKEMKYERLRFSEKYKSLFYSYENNSMYESGVSLGKWQALCHAVELHDVNLNQIRWWGFISTDDEVTRSVYASLFLAALFDSQTLIDSKLSDIDVFLDGIGLHGRKKTLCMFAEQLILELRSELLFFLNEKNQLKDNLFLDVIIFLRMDHPLVERDVLFLNKLSHFLGIDNDRVTLIISLVCHILSIPNVFHDSIFLGDCYCSGFGVSSDAEKALSFYMDAMKDDSSNLKLKYSIGRLYRFGIGIHRNYKIAFDYLNDAYSQGYLEAGYELALMYRDDLDIPQKTNNYIELMTSLAETGCLSAMRYLSSAYTYNEICKPNKEVAFKWALALAERGEVITIASIFSEGKFHGEWSVDELRKIYYWSSVSYEKYIDTPSWVALCAKDNIAQLRKIINDGDID
ncbi:dynamin family protein [Aeromonas enteropelogenes]|uniref:dynamin family protein n=1 Tax=Aeromonas enteropelogenes TaxID=29489 RepID=UPI003B9F96A5